MVPASHNDVEKKGANHPSRTPHLANSQPSKWAPAPWGTKNSLWLWLFAGQAEPSEAPNLWPAINDTRTIRNSTGEDRKPVAKSLNIIDIHLQTSQRRGQEFVVVVYDTDGVVVAVVVEGFWTRWSWIRGGWMARNAGSDNTPREGVLVPTTPKPFRHEITLVETGKLNSSAFLGDWSPSCEETSLTVHYNAHYSPRKSIKMLINGHDIFCIPRWKECNLRNVFAERCDTNVTECVLASNCYN